VSADEPATLAGRLVELYVVPFEAGVAIVSVGFVVSMRRFFAFASARPWPGRRRPSGSHRLPAPSRIVPLPSALVDDASSRVALSPGWTV